jgi:glutamine synthetase
MGELLDQILNEIEVGKESEVSAEAAMIRVGVNKLPAVMKDNTDRNRTSPFAFTGNKFEFRAVGASASTAFPVTVLNTAVADGFASLIDSIQKKINSTGQSAQIAVLEAIREALTESKPIRFEGNNYSLQWVSEAQSRQLPHLKTTPEALAQLNLPASKKLFSKLGIFSEAETTSRYHVRLERYIKNLWIEVDTLKAILDTQVLPSAYAYHSALAQGAAASKAIGMAAPQTETLGQLSRLIDALQLKRTAFDEVLNTVENAGDEEQKAHVLAHQVSPAMDELRRICDELEVCVGDSYWPLPKYREMLFMI